jgi:hypothetical protein
MGDDGENGRKRAQTTRSASFGLFGKFFFPFRVFSLLTNVLYCIIGPSLPVERFG